VEQPPLPLVSKVAKPKESMMRKWHRWLVVFFGVFLLWIAGTGVAMQVVSLFEGDRDEPAAGQATGPQPAARPERKEDLRHQLQELHSGEMFGPLGAVISTLSGAALLFFSFSGLWMYIQMWRNRAKRSLKPGWFWK
jgi:uncharacterized iron-regulated membrane protein